MSQPRVLAGQLWAWAGRHPGRPCCRHRYLQDTRPGSWWNRASCHG